MSGGGPSNARDAAVRIILEDIEPLVVRVEETALLLARVQSDLNDDLTQLGKLAQTVIEGQASNSSAVKRLSDTVGNAKAVLSSAPAAPTSAAPGVSRAGLVVMCITAAIVSSAVALLVGGAVRLSGVGHADSEDARLGRALTKAWPTLDQATKTRVNDAMNKTE